LRFGKVSFLGDFSEDFTRVRLIEFNWELSMCDPVKRPLTWDKKYYVYAERHGLYDVIQNLMKELAIWR